jgi:hypothetical protein
VTKSPLCFILVPFGTDAADHKLHPGFGRSARSCQGETGDAIATFLKEARNGGKDSPIFQLIDGLPVPNVEHMKADVFRDQVDYSEQVKSRLADARRSSGKADAARAVEKELGEIADLDTGVAIDLMLSYRAVSAWEDMVKLIGQFSRPLA